MRATRRAAGLAAATLVLATGASALLATPSTAAGSAPVQSWLQDRLASAAPTEVLRVYVHADTAAHARRAATAAGLGVQEVFQKVEVMVAPSVTTEGKSLQRQQSVGMGAF